jgi:hypothetical protein
LLRSAIGCMLPAVGDPGDEGLARAFQDAADGFAAVVRRPEVKASWDAPSACGVYTVGTLVGHVNSAIGWLGPLLDAADPTDLAPVALGNFYATAKIVSPDDHDSPLHSGVAALSHKAGQRGWEWNVERFSALAQRALEALRNEAPDRLLDLRPIAPIAARLDDFVRTRVLEIAIHTDDLAASIDADPPRFTTAVGDVVIATLVATARRSHGDLEVIRTLARAERATAECFPVF